MSWPGEEQEKEESLTVTGAAAKFSTALFRPGLTLQVSSERQTETESGDTAGAGGVAHISLGVTLLLRAVRSVMQ